MITDNKVIVGGEQRRASLQFHVAELGKSSVDDAILNAESYAWSATTMYPPACDWSRDVADSVRARTIFASTRVNICSSIAEGYGLMMKRKQRQTMHCENPS